MNILQAILGGVVASIVWFVVGGALYLNPIVAKVYKDAESSPAVKKWPDQRKYLAAMFTGGNLAQCLLWAFVFALVKPALPGPEFLRGIVFGLVLVAIKMFPRLFDMWIQTTYPNKLLVIEFVNGSLGGFIIGVIFAYII